MRQYFKWLPGNTKQYLKSFPIRRGTQGKFKSYLKKHDVKCLHLGCGTNILPNWLNTDIVSFGYHEVAYLDATKTYPFDTNSFQFVFTEHVFEHLSFAQQLSLLQESYRVLEKGGVIRLATPDLRFLDRLYHDPTLPLHEEYIKWSAGRFCPNVINALGHSSDNAVYVINNFHISWNHKIVHDQASLTKLMEHVGFTSVVRKEVSESSISELSNIEGHGDKIPKEFNVLETLILEAVKS